MSKFDKMLHRKNMMRDPEYCGNVHFVGFKTDENGELVKDDEGRNVPLFEQCGRRMKPRKLKNVVRWECTRKNCGGRRYSKRAPQEVFSVYYEKKDKE